MTEAPAIRVAGVEDVGIPRPSDWHIARLRPVSESHETVSNPGFILGITRSPKIGTTAGENPAGNQSTLVEYFRVSRATNLPDLPGFTEVA
jgi:hypothetical protein